jgi:pycsar effector protein
MNMSAVPNELVKDAREQLTLVLSFFSRVDAKASVVLAINTGMLAVLSSNVAPLGTMPIMAIIAASLSILMLAGSFWFLYKVAFPALGGGQQSLVYFREIANRTEARFIDEFIAEDENARLRDVLGQVWRNSEILKMKFDALRWAFVLMALAIVSWVISVSLFSAHIAAGRSLLER